MFSQNLPDLSQKLFLPNFLDVLKAHTKVFLLTDLKPWPEKEKRTHLLKGSSQKCLHKYIIAIIYIYIYIYIYVYIYIYIYIYIYG